MKLSARVGISKGFTLIELLIVIALLGALAVGLLATIDPFEQLKKGRDTSTRNTVSEFYNANLRYYSTKGTFPWGSGGIPGTTNTIDQMGSDVTTLVDAGELKKGFMELAGTSNLAKVYVTSTEAEQIAVCFSPESKSFQVDPNTLYQSNAGSQGPGYCKSDTSTGTAGTDTCYFCIQ